MRNLQPVVWSKGVFLSPQHLQAQDRFFDDTLRFLSGALTFCNWGFNSLQIDSAGLSEGRLSVSQASGIFPDGLMIDLPASDAPPASRALDECFFQRQRDLRFLFGRSAGSSRRDEHRAATRRNQHAFLL